MELVNPQKDAAELGGLRLVPDMSELLSMPGIEKQFVNFMFFRVNPEWRKLDAESKAIYKAEFQSVFDRFRDDFLLFT